MSRAAVPTPELQNETENGAAHSGATRCPRARRPAWCVGVSPQSRGSVLSIREGVFSVFLDVDRGVVSRLFLIFVHCSLISSMVKNSFILAI